MPGQRRAKSKLTESDLAYLAGLFDMSYGLGGANPNSAVRISAKPNDQYLNWLQEKYGGSVRLVPTNKSKEVFGWYLSIEERLSYFKLLAQGETLFARSLDVGEHDLFVQKMQRAINSEVLARQDPVETSRQDKLAAQRKKDKDEAGTF